MITKDEVLRALSEVRDPELKRSLTELGMVDKVEVDGGTVRVTVALTTRACPLQDRIADDVRAKLETLPGVERVEVDMSEMSKEKRDELFGRTLNAPIASPESKTRIIGRSEEHTSELQSRENLVCRLLLEKKKKHYGA